MRLQTTPTKKNERLIILGMGGTIAGKSSLAFDDVSYKAAQLTIEQLLPNDLLHTMQQDYQLEVVCKQIAQIDSKDIETTHWLALSQAVKDCLLDDTVHSIVITHGTDTLEETSFFLHCILNSLLVQTPKPVVMTCAMRPSDARLSDGAQNLHDACTVAAKGLFSGVWVVCAGKIYAPHSVQKIHPYRLDAFDSRDGSPTAYIENGAIRCEVSLPLMSTLSAHHQQTLYGTDIAIPTWEQWEKQMVRSAQPLDGKVAFALPIVQLIHSHACQDGLLVYALLDWIEKSIQKHQGKPHVPRFGLVVAATGNGALHNTLLAALQKAKQQGVHGLITTRCAYGQVVVSSANQAAMPMPLTSLAPVKARIALWLALFNKDET